MASKKRVIVNKGKLYVRLPFRGSPTEPAAPPTEGSKAWRRGLRPVRGGPGGR